jgi:flavin reductase (DIM6/NTAB) family NADH-FMN oxidoreductase RutF
VSADGPVPPEDGLPTDDAMPRGNPVPPGRRVPPGRAVPRGQPVPPASPVPPRSHVPGRGPVPPATSLPSRGEMPPGSPVPPRTAVPPPSGPVPAPPARPAQPGAPVPTGFLDALAAWPAGVTLLTLADGRDDIGATISAFCPVSADPPLVLVSLIAESYLAEVLGRSDPFAITVLAASQRVLAGRFAAVGRPSARLLLAGVPHRRGARSGALIPDDGLAAFECEVGERIPAGDHLLVVASVTAVPYAAESGDPLIRFRGGYLR